MSLCNSKRGLHYFGFSLTHMHYQYGHLAVIFQLLNKHYVVTIQVHVWNIYWVVTQSNAARSAVQAKFEPSLWRMYDDIQNVECTLPPLAFRGWKRNGGRERAFNFMSRFN